MAVHRNPRLPILSPAEFRRRVRPYLPGTVLELRSLWPKARHEGYEKGRHVLVGPYCSGCGHKIIWLCRPDRDSGDDGRTSLAQGVTSTSWLRVALGLSTRFPKPWPPQAGSGKCRLTSACSWRARRSKEDLDSAHSAESPQLMRGPLGGQTKIWLYSNFGGLHEIQGGVAALR